MQAKRQWTNKKKKQWEKCFNCRRYCRFQGHTCGASSEDSLGLELMACISTSCSKQPHTQVQKVRQADSEIDGAVKACFSQESRYCYKCVTDMLNPHRKQRGCCCRLPSWTNTDQLICQQVKSLPWLENGLNTTKKIQQEEPRKRNDSFAASIKWPGSTGRPLLSRSRIPRN